MGYNLKMGVNIRNTDATGAKQKIVYEFGATEKSVTPSVSLKKGLR